MVNFLHQLRAVFLLYYISPLSLLLYETVLTSSIRENVECFQKNICSDGIYDVICYLNLWLA